MSNKTILVVDDDKDVLTLLTKILATTGLTIIPYNNSKDFLDNLIRVKTRLGLLILDLNMPGTNGLVVLKKIQEIRKYTPFKVCVLSGFNDPAVIAKAIELGADAFLIKPFEKSTLLSKVRELLRIQNITLAETLFAKVNFTASLLNSTLLLNFNLVGISPEGVLIESIFNIKDESNIDFSCKLLCEAINYGKDFCVKVIRTKPVGNKFMISADFVGITLSQAQSLKSFIAQNIHEEISFYDS